MDKLNFNGLNVNCYKILITMKPGTYSLSDFQQVLDREAQSVTQTIKKLTECGFIRKSKVKAYYDLLATIHLEYGKETDFKNMTEIEADRKEKNNLADRMISYLNYKTGKHFRQSAVNRVDIVRRLTEGYTESDLIKVIDIKTAHWMNDDMMEQYLRPSTLFGSKFDTYLNSLRSNGTMENIEINEAEVMDHQGESFDF